VHGRFLQRLKHLERRRRIVHHRSLADDLV
jgi:hypothetical protein